MLRYFGRRVLSARVQRHSPKLPGETNPSFNLEQQDHSAFLRRTRTVGIIAHIDGGKTTTTERMLFYAGLTKQVGDVDQGTTVMDYLAQEQERGITIQSAAITMAWSPTDHSESSNWHRIQLIDTPGHADFTMEVERALRVMDGAVVLVDAVAGPQSQTKHVIRQAQRYQLPLVVMMNKMDREGANGWQSVRRLMTEVLHRSGEIVLPCQLWLGPKELRQTALAKKNEEEEVGALLDLIRWQLLRFDPSTAGQQMSRQPLTIDLFVNESKWTEALTMRRLILETLAELDDKFLETYLSLNTTGDPNGAPDSASLDPEFLQQMDEAIRRLVICRQVVPAFFGAALKNVGVQPLMDGMVKYLPSPLDAPPARLLLTNQTAKAKNGSDHDLERKVGPSLDEAFCGLAFKVLHDPHRGPMTFVRVYAGTLKQNDEIIMTPGRSMKERVGRLLNIYGSEVEEIQSLRAGDIGVVTGLRQSQTGDTLLLSREMKQPWHLPSIPIPQPVFSCSIEPMSSQDDGVLEEMLQRLHREDPSLFVHTHPETGQRLISGMGELHLDIVQHKLVHDLKVPCRLGRMWIAYRETLQPTAEPIVVSALPVSHTEFNSGKSYQVKMDFRIQTVAREEGMLEDAKDLEKDTYRNQITWNRPSCLKWTTSTSKQSAAVDKCHSHVQDLMKAVQQGIQGALLCGPLVGAPLYGTHIHIDSIETPRDIPPNILEHLARRAVSSGFQTSILKDGTRPQTVDSKSLLKQSQWTLLEPMMQVDISLSQLYLGSVMNDLTGKRGGQLVGDFGDDDALNEEDVLASDPRQARVRKSFIQSLEELFPESKTKDASIEIERTNASKEAMLSVVVPLSSMIGYAKSLRSLTKGDSSFSMRLHGFGPMPQGRVEKVMVEMRGF